MIEKTISLRNRISSKIVLVSTQTLAASLLLPLTACILGLFLGHINSYSYGQEQLLRAIKNSINTSPPSNTKTNQLKKLVKANGVTLYSLEHKGQKQLIIKEAKHTNSKHSTH